MLGEKMKKNKQKKKKEPAKEKDSLHKLVEFSDEQIKEALKTLPLVLPNVSDELVRGGMLWLALWQDEKEYEKMSADIAKEIRALDEYYEKRSAKPSAGVPTFFAHLYYIAMWSNTMHQNPDFKKAVCIANMPRVPPDSNVGYA